MKYLFPSKSVFPLAGEKQPKTFGFQRQRGHRKGCRNPDNKLFSNIIVQKHAIHIVIFSNSAVIMSLSCSKILHRLDHLQNKNQIPSLHSNQFTFPVHHFPVMSSCLVKYLFCAGHCEDMGDTVVMTKQGLFLIGFSSQGSHSGEGTRTKQRNEWTKQL